MPFSVVPEIIFFNCSKFVQAAAHMYYCLPHIFSEKFCENNYFRFRKKLGVNKNFAKISQNHFHKNDSFFTCCRKVWLFCKKFKENSTLVNFSRKILPRIWRVSPFSYIFASNFCKKTDMIFPKTRKRIFCFNPG
jgi:hypothetical protein